MALASSDLRASTVAIAEPRDRGQCLSKHQGKLEEAAVCGRNKNSKKGQRCLKDMAAASRGVQAWKGGSTLTNFVFENIGEAP